MSYTHAQPLLGSGGFVRMRAPLPARISSAGFFSSISLAVPPARSRDVQRFLAASRRFQRNAARAVRLEDFGRVSIGG
jgi:hypothetical protein